MAQSLEYEKMSKEIQGTDFNDLITPNNVFDNIKLYDSTVEVIGRVKDIEGPHYVGFNRQYKLFKFYLLTTGNEKKVPVLVWNNNITNDLCNKITQNSIVHLDGVQVTPPHPNYDRNSPYKLIIRENTVVTNLGGYEPINTLIPQNFPGVFCEILTNWNEYMIAEGYVKSNFMEREYSRNDSNTFGCGSITDGTYKLEIHINDFSHTDYRTLGIEKGDKIIIGGILRTDKNPIYLEVKDITRIRKLEGYMSFNAILKGHLHVEKRKGGRYYKKTI